MQASEVLKAQIAHYAEWVSDQIAGGATPVVTGADYTPVVGYVPQVYIEWTNERGSVLRQGASIVLAQYPENISTDYASEALRHLGIPHAFVQSWREWNKARLTPNAPAPVEDPVVGKVFDAERGLYYCNNNATVGDEYTQPTTGRKFVCVANGMFDRKWQEVQ